MPTKKIMKNRASKIIWREIEILYKLSSNFNKYQKQLDKVQHMSYIAYHTGLLNECAYIEILKLCGVAFRKDTNGEIENLNF